MAKYEFEINEVALPKREGQRVYVRFRTHKDGVLQPEMNYQVEIDPSEFSGKTDEEQFAIVKARVRQEGERIIGKIDHLTPLTRMQRYRLSAVDEGKDAPVPDPSKEAVIEPLKIGG